MKVFPLILAALLLASPAALAEDATAIPGSAMIPTPDSTPTPISIPSPSLVPTLTPTPAPVPTPSPTPDPDAWRFSGQILARTEMDGRDFDSTTGPLFWTVTRTRLGVGKSFFGQNLDFFVQIQDSRTFGDLGAAIGNLKNLDLYQGYFQVNHLFDQDLALQIGRFELEYGNGRLFHPLSGWNYLGQSFDGGRIKYRLPSWNKLSVDAFTTVIKNTTQAIRNPTPSAYPLQSDQGHAMFGVWSTAEFAKEAKVDAFAYYEIDRNQTTPGFFDISRTTLGVNHRGTYLDGLFSSTVEADYQTGALANKSLNAYLLSASAFVHPGPFHFGAGVDLVSGTNATNTTSSGSFAQPYGNNFAYYGYMDYFLNIPNNSKNLGLNDFYLRSSWTPPEWPVEIGFDLHHFMANQTASNSQNIYGQEADLTVTYKQGNNKYIWGLSGFLPGGLFSSDLFFGTSRNQPAFWSYVQAIVNF